jgi:pimeloyl-ACP methyl ester carboxylesterase
MRFAMRPAGLILSFVCVSLLAQTPGIEGAWQGTLDTPGGKLRVVFHLSPAPDAKLKATLDSPDQGAFGLPVDEASFDGKILKAEMKRLAATYEGTLSADGKEIAGKFTQGGFGMALNLTPLVGAPSGPNRPQNPKKPYPYLEQEVTFPNPKTPGVTLAGTLTIPSGKGPFPAVVLITGSGPQDRDETIFAHKPFWILADALTRKGVAVLRYDDRGTAKSTGQFGTATSLDFASDASAAVDFLNTRPELDQKKIGLCGHSEGGIIAPMVATTRPGIAFVVLMAGTAVTGEQVLYAQSAALIKAGGGSDAVVQQNREIQAKIFDILRAEKDPQAAVPKLKEALAGVPNADAQIEQSNSPWFRFFVFYDPEPALERLKAPILAIDGEKDKQVLADQNLPVIEAALKKGGNPDYTVRRLPGLNHLFQTAETGGVGEYAKIEETMSPVALDLITSWVRQRTGLEKK